MGKATEFGAGLGMMAAGGVSLLFYFQERVGWCILTDGGRWVKIIVRILLGILVADFFWGGFEVWWIWCCGGRGLGSDSRGSGVMMGVGLWICC